MSDVITRSHIESALVTLGMLRYWPSHEGTRAEIGAHLAAMCPHREALEWLVEMMTDHVGEWKGPREMRGVLCTRYKPRDGRETNCVDTIGFRAEDGEARQISKQLQFSAKPLSAEARKLLKACGAKSMDEEDDDE